MNNFLRSSTTFCGAVGNGPDNAFSAISISLAILSSKSASVPAYTWFGGVAIFPLTGFHFRREQTRCGRRKWPHRRRWCNRKNAQRQLARMNMGVESSYELIQVSE